MELIERIRRLRRDRRRLLFISQTLGVPPETAALTWMSRHVLFGVMATIFQLTGVILIMIWLLEFCLEFPTLSYWLESAVCMGAFVLSFYLLGRLQEAWLLALTALSATFALVLVDFTVANLRAPQALFAPVVDRTCYTPLRGRSFETPKQVCELEIRVGRYTHWINVTGTGLWMNRGLAVELRRGFLGLTYPRRAPTP